MIIASIGIPKCLCTVIWGLAQQVTEPEARVEVTTPLPPIVAPEVTVITTWNDKGIEVQAT
jgi:hypothetical protein